MLREIYMQSEKVNNRFFIIEFEDPLILRILNIQKEKELRAFC